MVYSNVDNLLCVTSEKFDKFLLMLRWLEFDHSIYLLGQSCQLVQSILGSPLYHSHLRYHQPSTYLQPALVKRNGDAYDLKMQRTSLSLGWKSNQ